MQNKILHFGKSGLPQGRKQRDPRRCGLRCITNPNCLSLINNRAGGNAPVIAQKIAERLHPEKQQRLL